MSRYQRHFRAPWWLVPATSIVAVAALVLRRGGRNAEVALLAGTAWALLVGSAATAGFDPRYLVPLFPLLVCAAALGIEALATRIGETDAGTSPVPVGEGA